MFVNKGSELIEVCKKENLKIWEYTINCEIERSGESYEVIWNKMYDNLKVMQEAASYGLTRETRSISGLIGGDSKKLYDYAMNENTLTGDVMVKAMARAVSCSEVNASMGRIVATPTAGSCGILPGSLITAGEKLNMGDEDLVKALFTASGVGNIIAQNATLSGAEGGCQAECGSAAAMASAAIVEMMGGTPDMALNAGAIVIKNILGLVCDPIAGLVEAPCAKRNMAGAVSALTTADMVMSGVKSIVPFDEVVLAMYKVGKTLPCSLRETALGGVAIAPTALELRKKVLGE